MRNIRSNYSPEQDTHLQKPTKEEDPFERLCVYLELCQDFAFFIVATPGPSTLNKVSDRLANRFPESFRRIHFQDASKLEQLPQELANLDENTSSKEKEGLIIFVSTQGDRDEVEAAWARTLDILNERRNWLMQACPHALIMAGTPDLPLLVHDHAPDLWSVRSSVFILPESPDYVPPEDTRRSLSWDKPWPLSSELEDGGRYKELADALGANPRQGEQASRGRLLARAADAWLLRGQPDSAMEVLEEAERVFKDIDDVRSRAVTMGKIADIFERRGKLDEALRIRREEQLPVYERLGDIDSLAKVNCQLGDGALRQGNRKQAEYYVKRSYDLLCRLQQQDTISLVGRNLGTLMYKLGNCDKALDILRQSRDAYWTLGCAGEADEVTNKITEIEKNI